MCCNMAKQLNNKSCHSCGKANFGVKRINNILIRECKDCKALFDTIKNIPFVQIPQFTISSKAQTHINRILEKLIHKGCKIEKLRLHISSNSELSELSSISTHFGKLAITINHHARKGTAYIQSFPGYEGFEWVSRTTKG